MNELEEFLAGLETDALFVRQVHDDVMAADFQPCKATLIQALRGRELAPLESYTRRLAEFDERLSRVTLYPLVTRPGGRFLEPKYPWLTAITIDLEGPLVVGDEDDAEAVFADLPDGFIKDWRFGLGLQKAFEPIVQMMRRVQQAPPDDDYERLDNLFNAPGGRRTLRLSREAPTQIQRREYVLNLADFRDLKVRLQRIQKGHQDQAHSERVILAHNTLLTDLDAQTYPPLAPAYRPDTLSAVLLGKGARPRLSRKDDQALLGAVGERARSLSRDAPDQVAAMVNAVQVANLDQLIERFADLLARKQSTEPQWQALLSQNRFLLSLVFGYPVVVVQEQAGVSGSNLQGQDARFADFLLKNPVTNSAALVELKRPSTPLVTSGEYAGVRNIASDLMQAVMQVLDQRLRFLNYLKYHQADGMEIEGWNVGCVVIAGDEPQDKAACKALDLYRHSLKDVVVLTYRELFARLVGLRDFLSPPSAPEQDGGEALF